MSRCSNLIGQLTKPVDENVVDWVVSYFDLQIRMRSLKVNHVARVRESHFQKVADTLRALAKTEEDHRILDEYLAEKRRGIATWRNNCRRCYQYERRSLIAELNGDDAIHNPYEAYWQDEVVELHKVL